MRLVPLVGMLSALSLAAAAAPAPAAINHYQLCGANNGFEKVHAKGRGSCEHAFHVLSRWHADGCLDKANPCAVAGHWGSPVNYLKYECHRMAGIDNNQRHFVAVACLAQHRGFTYDVRGLYYPESANAGASAFTRCPDEDTFVVAVYTAGVTCHHAYAVMSRWRVERCQHVAANCMVAYNYHDVGHRTYRCSSTARVDHKERHYYAVACMTDDRNHDVRARDYPRGDYKPD